MALTYLPKCPHCDQPLTYENRIWLCDFCGEYFEVEFREEDYLFNHLGSFGRE
jgi:ribosomal protein L37AE/L43A